MATLAGTTITSTYPLLLKIDSTGVDSTLRKVEDGDATDSALSISTTAIAIDATDKLYLDGGTHTYIQESADGVVDFYADNVQMLQLLEGGTDYVWLPIDSQVLTVGAGKDLQIYHNGSHSFIANSTGTLNLATLSSGIAISIGHSTSETTVNDNLTVTGDLAVTGGITVTGSSAFDIGDSDKLLLGDGDDLQIYHDGSNSHIANSTGALKLATESSGIAVSIGHTTSETTVNDNLTVTGAAAVGGNLTVTGTITASSTVALNDDVTLPHGKKIIFDSADTYIYANTDDPEDLVIGADADIILEPDGNVGIGTTAPNYQLEISHANGGSLGLHRADAGNAITDGEDLGVIYFGGDDDSADGTFNIGAKIMSEAVGAWEGGGNDAGGNLSFWCNTDGTGEGLQQVMTIIPDNLGLVGIGHAAPAATLDVKDAAGVSGQYVLKLTHTHASEPKGILIDFATTDGFANNDFALLYEDAGGNHFYIGGDGELWQATGGSTISSDIKLKENIVDGTPKLDDLNKLEVKNFNYKKTPDKKRLGFIAQDVEKIFPSLVNEHNIKEAEDGVEAEKAKGIQQQAFIPILVKAIQELSAKVTALENA